MKKPQTPHLIILNFSTNPNSMYADDTTIYFNLEDFDSQNTEADINAELEKVNTWLKLNKLSY